MTNAKRTAGTAAAAYSTQIPESCGYESKAIAMSAKAMNHRT